MSTSLFPRIRSGRRAPGIFAGSPDSAMASTRSDVADPGTGPRVRVEISDPDLAVSARDHVQAAGLIVAPSNDHRGAHALITDVDGLARHSTLTSVPTLAVMTTQPSSNDYCLALSTGARSIRELPRESSAFLGDLAALTVAERAYTVGVIPGSGGAGASSFAARLAGAGVRAGLETTLVDLDPLGGGLDTLVEAGHASGTRWDSLEAAGTGNGGIIRASLPVVDGVHLLTYPNHSTVVRTNPGADSVVEALSAVPGLLVVDVPLTSRARQHLTFDEVLLVVRGTDHGVGAARRAICALRESGPHLSLRAVVRHPRGGRELDRRDVEDVLQVPVGDEFSSSRPGVVPLLDWRRGGADAAAARYVAQCVSSGQIVRDRGTRSVS